MTPHARWVDNANLDRFSIKREKNCHADRRRSFWFRFISRGMVCDDALERSPDGKGRFVG